MSILIVSFDKNLVSKLKELLSQYDVLDVKNGEEAINTVSAYIDVIVYDAVSGAISEEDINNMYMQKFKDARYIILVDDLFPVDFNNLLPPKKIKLMRDKAVDTIKGVIEGKKVEEEAIELEKLPFQMEALGAPLQAKYLEAEEVIERTMAELGTPIKKKILVVSFDIEIIRKLRDMLSQEAEILEAKNMRDAAEKAKEADVIIFDTISAMLAQRTLTDMSKDESLARKPYILLIDELFTIDVESIPLQKKYTFAREVELSRVVDKALELLREMPSEVSAEAYREETPSESKPFIPEEEVSVMDLLEEIMGAGKEGTTPALTEEYVESQILEQPPQQPPTAEALVDSLASAIKDIIKAQLSQENLYSIISQVINYEDLREYVSRSIEEAIRNIIQERLSNIDIAGVVREEAYKVLKERLRELIT